MTVCPRCGTQNGDHLLVCGICGASIQRTVLLVPTPEPQAAPTSIRQTVIGHSAPDPRSGTLPLQVRPPAAPAPAPAAAPARRGPTQTLIGMIPDQVPLPPPAEPVEPGALPSQKTVLGVARPGIAPLHPGQEAAAPAPAPWPLPPPPQYFPPPEEPAPRPGWRVPIPAAIALTVAGALVSGAFLIWLWLRGTGEIEGRAVLGPDGRERLALRCAECVDGTVVRYQRAEATMKNHEASLALPRPLAIGDNEIELALRRPSFSREAKVTLRVPVEFRVETDLKGLQDPTPQLRVAVRTLPSSVVRMDGRRLELANGRVTHTIDLRPELTGPAPNVTRLERRVPYEIVPEGGDAKRGEAVVQIGVVPLIVDAPKGSLTIETSEFTLAGRTQAGATLSVDGHPLPIDAAGRFAQAMNVSSVGERTIVVRAAAADLAPRLVPVRIRRVASLKAHAAELRPKSQTSYERLNEALAQGQSMQVALDAVVIELRNEGHSSVLLCDVQSGCPAAPCLIRVLHGARAEFGPNAEVTLFGSAARSVDGPRTGSRIPELESEFILERRRR